MYDDFSIVDNLNDDQVVQLYALIRQQWWGGKRTIEDVRLMVKNTSLLLGLVTKEQSHLVGFARVLTDFAFRATIYDVMVTRDLQGQGLGRRLMDELCQHPKLSRVSFIYLACEPRLMSFYKQWGFSEYEGRAEWMIKIQRAE